MHHRILQKTALSIIVCTILVVVSYYYVDKPFAEFVYQHTDPILHKKIRDWALMLSQILHFAAPIFIVLLILKKLFSDHLSKLQLTFLAIAINLIVTDSIKDILKLAFGRYRPVTWMKNGSEWLQSPQYGFHPFHGGLAYQSFPSGHAAAIFAIMTVIWIVYPKWRWLSILSCAVVIFFLLALNYHFVSDIVAGAFLGAITGTYTVYLFVLDKRP